MVHLPSPSTNELLSNSESLFDVDYNNNPTELFKFIEAKDWDNVKTRVKESPQDAATWITRRGKDNKIRWRILPLHASLCVKAPTDVVLSILNAYSDACSLSDDQGLLPIHLAIQDEDIDEEIIQTLLKVNPSGLSTKDKEGKVIIGRPMLLVIEILRKLEKEKIQLEGKTSNDGRDSSFSLLHSPSINLGSGFQKYIKLLKVNEELQNAIETQKVELTLKDEQLQSALAKIASQEESISMYQQMTSNMCELSTVFSNISELKNTASLLQEQLDAQERDLKQKQATPESKDKKVEVKSTFDEFAADAKQVYVASLDKLTNFLNEVTVQSKYQLEKIEESYMSREGNENGKNELTTLNDQYQILLEKVILFLDESMNQFNDQMTVMKDSMKSRGLDVNSIETKAAEVADAVNNNYRSLLTALKDQFEKIDEEYKVQDKCRVSLEMATKFLKDVIVRLNDEMMKIKKHIVEGEVYGYLSNAAVKGLATTNDIFQMSCKKMADMNAEYLCLSDDPRSSMCNADYHFNPTVLFKLIESKDWEMVKERIEDNPQEAGSWITKHRKDGSIRWKMLPLHAVLCIKAPKDVVVPVINAFPEACSQADDQGMLPIDIAKSGDSFDDEVLQMLQDLNSSGEIAKDEEINQ